MLELSNKIKKLPKEQRKQISAHLKDDEFLVQGKIINSGKVALCFKNKNGCRLTLVNIVESAWFDKFILCLIVLNTITLGIFT